MRPVVRSLKRDIRRMVTVPAAWIVIIGLLFVPALYAWFNIVGFWDPYSNTGKIRVAVANEDQGATKDAIGFVNVGTMLESKLRENDQLGWHFVSAEQAKKEVERGESYAAFIIPSDFSTRLTGVVDGTYTKPDVQYYVNEKNNAVAPKITGAGASSLDQQINSAFVSTVAQTLSEKITSTGKSISEVPQNARFGKGEGQRRAKLNDERRLSAKASQRGLVPSRSTCLRYPLQPLAVHREYVDFSGRAFDACLRSNSQSLECRWNSQRGRAGGNDDNRWRTHRGAIHQPSQRSDPSRPAKPRDSESAYGLAGTTRSEHTKRAGWADIVESIGAQWEPLLDLNVDRSGAQLTEFRQPVLE